MTLLDDGVVTGVRAGRVLPASHVPSERIAADARGGPGSEEGAASAIGRLVARTTAAVRSGLELDPFAESAVALLEVPALLEELTRATDALRALVLPAIESGGLWALDGQRSFATWTATATGTSYGRARRDVHRARHLRDHLPAMSRALRDGALGVEHVDALTQHALTSGPRAAALAHPEAGEEFLAATARETTPTQFRQVVRAWAAAVDPEAEDRAYREACAEERVSLARTMGGWHLEGWLGHETGLTLRTALDAAAGMPAADDARSRGARDAAALASLARLGLESGAHGAAARLRPHLLVHVPVDTLARLGSAGTDTGAEADTGARDDVCALGLGASFAGTSRPGASLRGTARGAHVPADPAANRFLGAEPATFADGTPLAPAQLAHHVCSATLTRILLDPRGHPLDVGRAQRIFTAAQTKAVIARDRHCQYPGCSAPPTWCEVHHVLPWSEGGATDMRNAILLCWTHHHELHRLRRAVRGEEGAWVFARPDGTVHGTTRRPAHPPVPGALPVFLPRRE